MSKENENETHGQRGAPTAYDNAFRTLQTDCPRLILPVLNEIFGKKYKGNEAVLVYSNELFPEGIEAPGTRIVTDSNMTVVSAEGLLPYTVKDINELEELLSGGGADGYQVECESSPHDETIWVRIYKYGVTSATHTAVTHGDITDVYLPQSALIYLRSTKNTADRHMIRIHASRKTLDVEVPVLKVSKYGLDELFEKKLYFLIPFYIFNREKELGRCVAGSLELEGLKSEFERIRDKLSELEGEGKISTFEKSSITNMTIEVVGKIAEGNNAVKSGLEGIMGGMILDYEAKRIFKEGKAEGKAEGKTEGEQIGDKLRAQKTAVNMYRKNMALDLIAEILEQKIDVIRGWVEAQTI